jgi:arylformamidase
LYPFHPAPDGAGVASVIASGAPSDGPFPDWRTYDQAALDAQYDQRSTGIDVAPFRARKRLGSEVARRELRVRLDVPYGSDPAERLDLYLPDSDSGPVIAFFHGGAWRSGDRRDEGFRALAWVPRGCVFAAIEVGAAPATSLATQVARARTAVAWLASSEALPGGGERSLVVAGHSSGGHLAAMVATTDWAARSLPAGLVRAACLTSGIYDLEPVARSARNETLHLTPDDVLRWSPIRGVPSAPEVLIACGGAELAEFQRQASACHGAWANPGANVRHLVLEGHHHDEMGLELGDPMSPVSRWLARQIGLTAPELVRGVPAGRADR